MNAPPFPIRTECPPGSCVCEREALMHAPGGDTRILRLTREEERRLVQRLEQITSLADLRHMERRLFEQLGVRLTIGTSPNGVRSLRVAAYLAQQGFENVSNITGGIDAWAHEFDPSVPLY